MILSNCESNQAFTKIKKKFENANPDFPLKCPGINFVNFNLDSTETPYYFEGSSINNNYSYFDLELSINKNLIYKYPNKTEIIEKFRYLRLKVYYSNVDMHVDKNNYTAIYYASSRDLLIGTDKFYMGRFGFMQHEVVEDSNLFIPDTSSKQEYILNDDAGFDSNDVSTKSIASKMTKYTNIEGFINNPNETLGLGKIQFSKTKNIFKYNIGYKKLPYLIAQAGGILNAIVVFIKVSADALMDFQFYSKILNQTLDIDIHSTNISEVTLKNSKTDNIKQDGGERLKKLFAEINFIHQTDKKKSSIQRTANNDKNTCSNKSNSNSNRKLIDQTHLELVNKNHQYSIDHGGSEPLSNNLNFNKRKDEIIEQNNNINFKNNSVLSKNDNSASKGGGVDSDKMNKFNSYLVAAEKAQSVNGGAKKSAKIKDDVFFKDDVFNFVDFVYGIYKYCSNSKITPIGYIKILDNREHLYEKSKNNFYKNFEVNNIIKKNIEIDLIKFLLMSSDQLNLYRLVKKPIISLTQTDLSAFDKAYDEFSEDRLYSKNELRNLEATKKEDIKNSFLNIHEKKQSNVINRKLLRMVEERVSLFLEE